MIKRFEDFLNRKIEEASLEDNPGIPGEPGGEYRKELEKRARDYYLPAARDQREIGQIVGRVLSLQRGHEEDLEKLAEKAIRLLYKDIIEDVTLDIKFAKPREIPQMMAETPEEEPPLEELKDRKIISEIQKRKILNCITQGEAVNSKKALNLPEIKDRMAQIMGKEKSEEFIKLLNKLADVAHSFYWTVPVEAQKQMWKTNKGGMSGAVKVDGENKDEEDEDLAAKILSDLEESKEGKLPEEAEDLFFSMQPKIIARGLDFSMLVHEGVKGVYELIASAAIPEDEGIATIVIMNTDTLADEIEDLRFGPEMAKDIRDFINTFPESDDIDNLKEYVLGKIYALDSEEFLEVIRLILNGDDSVRSIVQEMIDEVAKELREYGLYLAGIDSDEDYVYEPEASMASDEEDPSQLSQDELGNKIIDAASSGNFEEVERLRKYLKESKEIERVYNYIENSINAKSINESDEFRSIESKKKMRVSIHDGKTGKKKKEVNTSVEEVIYEGNQYFIKCSEGITIVYDKETSQLVEGDKPEYLVYRTEDLSPWILDLLI